MADERAQLAVAAFAIEAGLQGIAAYDGDLLGGSDSSVAYMGHVGSGIACALGGGTLDLPPSAIASGATLSWWNTGPQAGDSLTILDEGLGAGAADDRWLHAEVRGVSAVPNACLHTPFLDSLLDAGRVGWRLSVVPALPVTVTPGAPVRVLRPERFALYRSSGEWMVGWSEWNAAALGWNVIQPLAGPLLPYAASGGTSGLSLRWSDSTGGPMLPAPGARVRSLRLGLGAVTRQSVRVDGVARGIRRDSLSMRVPLRNAP